MRPIHDILFIRRILVTLLAIFFLISTGRGWAEADCAEREQCATTTSRPTVACQNLQVEDGQSSESELQGERCECECPCHLVKSVIDLGFRCLSLQFDATHEIDAQDESLIDGPFSKIDQPPKLPA